MKKNIGRWFLILSGLISSTGFVNAIPQDDQLTSGYYVVVAAYGEGDEAHAQKYADKINQGGLHAKYGLDATRKLIYVYLAQYTDFNEAIREMEKARQGGGFSDAWVRVIGGSSGGEMASKPAEKSANKKVEDLPADKVVKPAATVYVAIPKPGNDQEVKPTDNSVTASNEAVVVENPKAEPVYLPQTLASTPIFMSLFNEKNGRMVDGEIEVHDTERARLITKVKSNSYLKLPDPKSKSGQLTLVCNAFGYRKVKHEVNFKNTEADTLRPYVDLVGNFYLVKFDLVRFGTGDVSTLENVDFYNESAIMLPESKSELMSLLQMMKENEKYKIMLHGHTNGNSRGAVITMGPSKNFFALTSDVVRGTGSAKELSEARAQVIKDWLISQGVGEDRIQTKGWGGGKMIHDQESVNAKQNVRVEMEILSE